MSSGARIGVLVLTFAAIANTHAAREISSDEDRRAVAVYAPPPEYPLSARRERITGRVVVVQHVDARTGNVTKVEIAESSGRPILDNAAVSAFRRWRFKPGTVSKVRTPVTFAMPMTISPIRRYPFSGTITQLDLSASTMSVRGSRGTDIIEVTPRTQLRKNGKRAGLAELAVGDRINGRATVRLPDFRAVAQVATITAAR